MVCYTVPYREFHYRWEYRLSSSPEKLWPFVADTNRFNRDNGLPSLQPESSKLQRLRNARRRLRMSFLGLPLEWEEQPFEWIRPSRFGVSRTYSKGPVADLKILAELTPITDGTLIVYQIWARPKSPLGYLMIPIQIGLSSKRRFARTFKDYDQSALNSVAVPADHSAELSPLAHSRLEAMSQKLVDEGARNDVVERLVEFISTADDFSLSKIRPYALADEWQLPRRAVLEACLRATRVGLLDLQWDLVCPLCRGAKESESSLRDINSTVHCETCRIDFTVNLDRFVEVTFKPNALVRQAEITDFCVGSPQRTPHVVMQQLLPPQSHRTLRLPLELGNYGLRALELSGEQLVTVVNDGKDEATITISDHVTADELRIAPETSLRLENATADEHLLLLERMEWSDQAATAAEITSLQIFRDLFSTEALRPGDQISVGTLTVLFTDLRNSTRLYREIGDATAFGRVMNHFDVLRQAISEQDGAMVKTIGDAVMAVFRNSASALRAMLRAQRLLATPAEGTAPLTLKAGIHTGPCIAVTLNDRLDYFGSTVNLAARLEGLSSGQDVIISGAVYADPEVRELIESSGELRATPFEVELKGFDEERFNLWRIMSDKL